MGRYRPPQAKSSTYITPGGFTALQEELESIWKHRATVTKALAAAAAEGDRSENAEYIYRKKELREIDRRIRYLQKRLPELIQVKDGPTDQGKIFFGAWIRLEDIEDNESVYRIVGPDETDSHKGYISMDAPLARALMKKSVGDEIRVQTPGGEHNYYILEISYIPLT